MSIPFNNEETVKLARMAGYQDDGRDYTGVIVARMRGVSGLKSSPFTPPPKPVGEKKGPVKNCVPACANIGKRRSYSRIVIMAVYQLHQHGKTDKQIAQLTGIPQADVAHLMKHGTDLQRSLWKMVTARPVELLPTPKEIVSRLSKEGTINPVIKRKNRK